MRPVILANSVSSLPRPTFRPGFTRVPRWRTIIVPPGTSCPPKALKPNRWALESRPFREVPCPFLCAIADPVVNLFLLFWRSFLRHRLFSRSLFLCGRLVRLGLGFDRVRVYRRGLLRLGNFFGQFGGGELLPVKCDFCNPHRRIALTMSPQLLVLLLAFVVEDQDLFLAALLDHFSSHKRPGLGLADLTLGGRKAQNGV